MIADLKYALRSLAKHPGFAATALLTLALGIGASTAHFSPLDATLLRPLPYPNQERILGWREVDETGRRMSFARPNGDALRPPSRTFAARALSRAWPPPRAGGAGVSAQHRCLVPIRDFSAEHLTDIA